MTTSAMSKEKRDSLRIVASFKVEMTNPEVGTILTKTRDISDGGAFVFTQEGSCPKLNTRIKLRVLGLPGEEASPVESEVVRIESDGIGVKFISEEPELDDDDLEFLNS